MPGAAYSLTVYSIPPAGATPAGKRHRLVFCLFQWQNSLTPAILPAAAGKLPFPAGSAAGKGSFS